MGTGAVSALLHNFPYHNDSKTLKIMALIIFLLNLVLFVFVCTCTVLRYVLYPEVGRDHDVPLSQSNLTATLDMVPNDIASCTESVHRLFSYGCCNAHQRRISEHDRCITLEVDSSSSTGC